MKILFTIRSLTGGGAERVVSVYIFLKSSTHWFIIAAVLKRSKSFFVFDANCFRTFHFSSVLSHNLRTAEHFLLLLGIH